MLFGLLLRSDHRIEYFRFGLDMAFVRPYAFLDEVVFQRMDRRVAKFLIKKGQEANPIRITHQEIAAELGSSREVVSRLLEDFMSEGSIQSVRGVIEILDFELLKSRSAM